MNEMTPITFLSAGEGELEGGNASFLYAVMRTGEQMSLLSSEEIDNLQCALYALLAKQTQRYTMGDSSSIPVETAQRLLHSVCFCIGMELRGSGGIQRAARRLTASGIPSLFEKGRARIKDLRKKGADMLAQLKNTAFSTSNRAFRDTVFHALPDFFARYDPDFFAHEIPCSIDYPLFYPVEELEGIQYINEYIRRMMLECSFLARFDTEHVLHLLQGYCPEPDEQLINLFEPVLTNAVGLALLHKDCMMLNIIENDRYALLQKLHGWSGEELALHISEAVECVYESIGTDEDPALSAYISRAEKVLCERITLQLRQNDLSGLFPSFQQAPELSFSYIDGEPMPDEELRTLIAEMRSCRYTADKTAMLKRQVKSLRDYVEVLPECFEEEEYTAAFALLMDEEIAALLRTLYARFGEWPGPAESGWISALVRYIGAFPDGNKARILSMAGEAREDLLK